jgi:glutathione S-transferase
VAEPLVLFVEAYWRSPWDFSVYVALREKRVEFSTSIAMMRPGVGALDALAELSFTGTAPVLQHGSLWIAESLAIAEYIEEAFPAPLYPRLLPADLKDRARARQLMSWVRTGQHALRRDRPIERIIWPDDQPWKPLEPDARKVADQLIRVVDKLGANPGGLFGGEFGAVDADLGQALMRLLVAGDPMPAAVEAYARASWARPSVREFMERSRPPHPPPITRL